MSREYDSEAKTAMYLAGADRVPHRDVGEALLLDRLPEGPLRVLDLGCGDGRLLSLVLASRPGTSGLAVDVSPPMLERARRRFGAVQGVEVIAHDLREPLPSGWGRFQAVVSSFAIHHLDHVRKRGLYGEVVALLQPGGVFCNLEHVSSASARLHQRFLDCFAAEEDETNILLDVETQLRWLRELGLIEVDCDWKWRELALLAGVTPQLPTTCERAHPRSSRFWCFTGSPITARRSIGQFWLSAQLAAAGHQVLYPGLPSPDTPSYASWAAIVHGHLAEMDAPCRTVICHSLSCLLWLSLSPQVPRTLRPERVLLVAPPDPLCVRPAGHEFIRPFSATAAAASAMQELRVACADNDPYNPAGARGMYGERLGCPVDVLEHAAHVTPESGYGP